MRSWNAVIQSHVDYRNTNGDELKNTGCLRSFIFLVQNREWQDFISEWATYVTNEWNHSASFAQVFLDPTLLYTADPLSSKTWRERTGCRRQSSWQMALRLTPHNSWGSKWGVIFSWSFLQLQLRIICRAALKTLTNWIPLLAQACY